MDTPGWAGAMNVIDFGAWPKMLCRGWAMKLSDTRFSLRRNARWRCLTRVCFIVVAGPKTIASKPPGSSEYTFPGPRTLCSHSSLARNAVCEGACVIS